MKKLFSIIGLVSLLAFSVSAASSSTTLNMGVTNSAFTAPLYLNSVSIANATTTNAWVALFDTSTNITYTYGPYTNTIYSSPVSITNVWTNYFGALNTNIFSGITNTTSVTVLSTNTYPLVALIYAPTNTTTEVTIEGAFIRGLKTTNSATVTATWNYQQ